MACLAELSVTAAVVLPVLLALEALLWSERSHSLLPTLFGLSCTSGWVESALPGWSSVFSLLVWFCSGSLGMLTRENEVPAKSGQLYIYACLSLPSCQGYRSAPPCPAQHNTLKKKIQTDFCLFKTQCLLSFKIMYPDILNLSLLTSNSSLN